MTTTQDLQLDADIELTLMYPDGAPTVDGTPYHPTTTKFLTAVFGVLAGEGFGTADGPTFQAFTGQEDAAADRIAELLGLDTDGDHQ